MTPAEERRVANGRISLKEHYDALRVADEKLREALRVADEKTRVLLREADAALQAERDRRYREKDEAGATALAAALLAVKDQGAAALKSIATATDVLAATTRADKAAANEWRGTVNDIISKMGGAKMMWGALAGAIVLGFLIWNNLKQDDPVPAPRPTQDAPPRPLEPDQIPEPQ